MPSQEDWDKFRRYKDRGSSRDRLAEERLKGGIIATESAAHVLTEALHCMVEAHQLIVNGYGGDAIATLEQGIAETKYALNEGPEPS